MISFNSFVNTIHNAIMEATDFLMEKNQSLIDKYFEEKDTVDATTGVKTTTLAPRTVSLLYHKPTAINAKPGEEKESELQSSSFVPAKNTQAGTAKPQIESSDVHIQVPLITLVPLSMPQIEKATLTAEFMMQIVNGELQLEFSDGGGMMNSTKNLFRKSRLTKGTLEITISPQQPTEGLQTLINAYENQIKQQIP